MKDQKSIRAEVQKRKMEIATQLRVINPFPGGWESVLRGEGYDFADIREYEPGDNIKKIHLPTLAKTDDYYIVERVAEKQLKIMMLTDFSGSMSLYEKPKIRTMALGLLTVSALHYRTLVGMAAFSDKVKSFIQFSIDDSQLDAILDFAVGKEKERKTGEKTDFGKLPLFLDVNFSPKNLMFLISDFLVEDLSGLNKLLEISKNKYDIVPVIIKQSPDFFLPDFSCQIDWRDAETGLKFSFAGSKNDFQKLNQKNIRRFEEMESLFKKYGLEFVLLQSSNVAEGFREFSKCFARKIKKRV